MADLALIAPPVGIDFDSDEGILYNGTATALVAGDVMVVDVRSTVNGVTGLNTFDPTALLWTHVRFSSTGLSGTGSIDASSGWIVIAQQSIPSGALGKFRARGDTLANIAAAATFSNGANLVINGSGGGQGTRFLTPSGGDAAASVSKVVAKAKAAVTAGVPTQISETRNGLSGFG